ncbi:unnamed protein product, partial [Prorocentrum cordatum]
AYDLMSRYPDEFTSTKKICGGKEALVSELASLYSAVGGKAPAGNLFQMLVGNETIRFDVK